MFLAVARIQAGAGFVSREAALARAQELAKSGNQEYVVVGELFSVTPSIQTSVRSVEPSQPAQAA